MKQKNDGPLSKFAFNFNLRRYSSDIILGVSFLGVALWLRGKQLAEAAKHSERADPVGDRNTW